MSKASKEKRRKEHEQEIHSRRKFPDEKQPRLDQAVATANQATQQEPTASAKNSDPKPSVRGANRSRAPATDGAERPSRFTFAALISFLFPSERTSSHDNLPEREAETVSADKDIQPRRRLKFSLQEPDSTALILREQLLRRLEEPNLRLNYLQARDKDKTKNKRLLWEDQNEGAISVWKGRAACAVLALILMLSLTQQFKFSDQVGGQVGILRSLFSWVLAAFIAIALGGIVRQFDGRRLGEDIGPFAWLRFFWQYMFFRDEEMIEHALLFKREIVPMDDLASGNVSVSREPSSEAAPPIQSSSPAAREIIEIYLTINDMVGFSQHIISGFAIENAVRLTHSELGYFALMNDCQTELTLLSSFRLGALVPVTSGASTTLSMEAGGILGVIARERKQCVMNDASPALNSPTPFQGIALHRQLHLPLIDAGRIVAVAGVANKAQPFDETDAMLLKLLMVGVWRAINSKKVQDAPTGNK